MRTLLAVLLILATPLCAQAGSHWRDSGGAQPPAYTGGGRPAYAPPPPPHGGYRGPPSPYAPPPPHGGYRGPPAPYGLPPGPAYAVPSPRTQQQRARDDVRSGRRAPLPMVIERLRRSTGAEYVDTREVRDPSGRPLYVLRFRQRGRYFDVPVDAETGLVQR